MAQSELSVTTCRRLVSYTLGQNTIISEHYAQIEQVPIYNYSSLSTQFTFHSVHFLLSSLSTQFTFYSVHFLLSSLSTQFTFYSVHSTYFTFYSLFNPLSLFFFFLSSSFLILYLIYLLTIEVSGFY
ncbi:hypothetical protein ACN38_g13034 [Penicillium nordicum]|uniref:Uncharacterized protein n=1 Tax=Penicillium nordicum TaxID=229535 RepID=A0A0M8NXD2_9EURO|nr:hypothetical protein ACN38_g13034 [Penicillium nordicum]